MSDFADLARRALRESGYSMKSAARAMNYDPAYLSRVLNRRQVCSPVLAMALDKLLGMNGSLASAVLSRDDRERVNRVSVNPSRIDDGTVTALAGVLSAYRRLDDATEPKTVVPAGMVQMRGVLKMLEGARGAHRKALTETASEWCQFGGWLLSQVRRHSDADRLLNDAVKLANQVDNGTLAAQALHFQGHAARQRCFKREALACYIAAAHTPGAHPAQRMTSLLQAATQTAVLGDSDGAIRMMGDAECLVDKVAALPPPSTAYWLTSDWCHLGLGTCALALGRYRDAVDHLRRGLDAMPRYYREAYWAWGYAADLRRAESLC